MTKKQDSTKCDCQYEQGHSPECPLYVEKKWEFDELQKLKAHIAKCLKYCREQNGLPYCKNCGLEELIENK